MSNLHWNTVDPALRVILVEIMTKPLFDPFRLVGGTSLSLQLGHRKSVDIEIMYRTLLLLVIASAINSKTFCQQQRGKDFLILVSDSAKGTCGYRNDAGKIVIPLGKYSYCFTDTFRSYAIVIDSDKGIVGIDRWENILYHVFIFDNGPDYPSNGLFRIRAEGKIGYANAATGRIAIKPQFACAWPFEQGLAKVALTCQTRSMGEHQTWISDRWFYINKKGIRVDKKYWPTKDLKIGRPAGNLFVQSDRPQIWVTAAGRNRSVCKNEPFVYRKRTDLP